VHEARSRHILITRLFSELNAVISPNGMSPIRDNAQETFEKFSGCLPVYFLDQLYDSEFACRVDSNEAVQLTFSSLGFGNINVKKAYRIAFEAMSFWLASLHVTKP
jgi:hypothetical protein